MFYDVTDVKEDSQNLRAQYGEPQGPVPGTRNSMLQSAAVRKGVSAEEDAAYMDAVRRGDMETAQREDIRDICRSKNTRKIGLY